MALFIQAAEGHSAELHVGIEADVVFEGVFIQQFPKVSAGKFVFRGYPFLCLFGGVILEPSVGVAHDGAEVVVGDGTFWGRGVDQLLGPGGWAGKEKQDKKGWGVPVFHMIGIGQGCPKILSFFVKKNWDYRLNFVRKREQYGKDH